MSSDITPLVQQKVLTEECPAEQLSDSRCPEGRPRVLELLQRRSPKDMLLRQLQQSQSTLAAVKESFEESQRTIKRLTRQKENLMGTCQDQFEYIGQLQHQLAQLQQQKNQTDEQFQLLEAHSAEQACAIASLSEKLRWADIQIVSLEELVQKEREKNAALTDLQLQFQQVQQELRLALRQKENLAGTCRDQAEYIGELKDKISQLQLLQSDFCSIQEALQQEQMISRTAQSKLAEMEAARQQQIHQVNDLQSHIELLEQEKQKLACEVQGLQKQLEKTDAELALKDEHIHLAEAQRQQLKTENAALLAELQQQKQENTALLNELAGLKDAGEKYQAAASQCLLFEEQILKLSEQVKEKDIQLEAAAAELGDYRNRRQQWEEEAQRYTSLAEQLAQQCRMLEAKLQAAEDQLRQTSQAAHRQQEEFHHRIQAAECQRQEAHKQIDALKANLDEACGQISTLQSRLAAAAEAEIKYQQTLEQVESLQKDIRNLHRRLESQTAETESARLLLQESEKAKTILQEKLNQEKTAAKRLSLQKSGLERQLEDAFGALKQLRGSYLQLQQTYDIQADELEKTCNQYQQQIEQMQGQLDGAVRQTQIQDSQIQELNRQYEQLAATHRDLQVQYEQQTRTLDAERADNARQINTLQEQLDGAVRQIQIQDSQIQEPNRQYEQLAATHRDLQVQYEQQTRTLDAERADNARQINTLQEQLDEKTGLTESLQAQIDILKVTEEAYHGTLEQMQLIQTKQEELQGRLEAKISELERAHNQLEQSRLERHKLEEELNHQKLCCQQLNQQKDNLASQIETAAAASEQIQKQYRQILDELEFRKRQFKSELDTRDQQIRSLQERLQEALHQIQEFESMLELSRTEASQLRQTADKTTQQIIHLQSRIAQQNMEYAALQDQLASLQRCPIELSDNPSDFENAQIRIQLLSQDLTRETQAHAAARQELETCKTHLNRLENQLQEQNQLIQSLQQEKQDSAVQLCQMQQELESLQKASANVLGLERRYKEAVQRVENLTAQVKEQTESLKKAHQTINFLRMQKTPSSVRIPGVDTPARPLVTPPCGPKTVQSRQPNTSGNG
ncbi:MAG TPA: hypothetical protein PK052_09725 [Anaerohalosphaeraceae bacterium]|nr:hypothetical protein [Anaerohalosphaeraceae bacterium]